MKSTTNRRAVYAMLTGLVLLSAGCGTAPGVSNGSVSVCFRAIPVGKAAVHDKNAKLVGVHHIPLDQVRSHLPAAARSELAAEDDTAVCEMTFRGTFRPGQVELAPPGESGSYALVLVSSKRLHLVRSVVLKHLPRAFSGRTV